MVALVIAFPGMVTANLDKGTGVDPSKVTIEIQAPPSWTTPRRSRSSRPALAPARFTGRGTATSTCPPQFDRSSDDMMDNKPQDQPDGFL